MNHILHRTANLSLLTFSHSFGFVRLFAIYFSDKISKLHFNLLTNPSPTSAHHSPSLPILVFPLYSCLTTRNHQFITIFHNLSHSFKSSFDLDSIPITVLKNITNELSCTILSIVLFSFSPIFSLPLPNHLAAVPF